LLLPRKSSSSSAPRPRRHHRAIYKAYIRWPYWASSSICTSCAKPVGFLLSSLSFIIYLCHFSGTEITGDARCEKCKRATGPFKGECRKLEGHFWGGCGACVRDGHATTCEVQDAPSPPPKQVEIVEKTLRGGRQTKAPTKYTA
jgi:hypothetical protein